MSPSVVVRGVSKQFVLRHDRSMKQLVMARLRGTSLTDRFDALKDVDLEIEHGDSLALLGMNGSGKSTLLKIISGVMRPDAGSVAVAGRLAGLIEVGAGFHPDLTGRENVFLNAAILGMDEPTTRRRFDEIVAFSEIERFIDTEVRHYSSGMFLRLAFSVCVHTDPEVFLVDEILAVGDEPFQRKCMERIARLHAEGRTLVIVSHDLDKVVQLCQRGMVLEHGRVVHDATSREAVAYLRGEAAAR